MFLLYLYGILGLLTASVVTWFIVAASTLPDVRFTAHDWSAAAATVVASFFLWPAYAGYIAYDLWRGE